MTTKLAPNDLRSLPTVELVSQARSKRDAVFGNRITYSRKVFLPLTQLCRDVCHYCVFAQAPRSLASPYMTIDQVLAVAREGKRNGCKEALFTLGDKPELRYRVAADWLDEHGFESTIHYVAHAAGAVLKEVGLLPHINAGILSDADIALLRPVSASMGIMLESASERLFTPGMPHHGSPDKAPAERLAALARLGERGVPTTSGILIGIGENEDERIDALLALAALNANHGHIQEIIVQNFRAKVGTRMAKASEPDLDALVRTIAIARLIMDCGVSIQAPPNLNRDDISELIDAGIDDLGGISPVTKDFVNPESPWPQLVPLSRSIATMGKSLTERMTIYPAFAAEPQIWLAPSLATPVLKLSDASGLGRESDWRTGDQAPPPPYVLEEITAAPLHAVSLAVGRAVDKAARGAPLAVAEIERLFATRGADLRFVCEAADALRKDAVGDTITYVVTRNINYTNVCTYGCSFCAFSKGKTSEELRGKPYNISLDEVSRRTVEAWHRGGTEVCMQGGINPSYTGDTYISICKAVKRVCPSMHVHAFSPLEVTQGARTLGIPVAAFLQILKSEGLGSLPGTAAEILDDEVRAVLCPDKLTTREWLDTIEAAHGVGLRTTATIMFGHIDAPVHWARHIAHIRSLQDRTGGFTEFVPLPFVASEAPLYLRGRARPGPTFRESVLMHAVARIAFHTAIPNIQASWVKLGPIGLKICAKAGVNDFGGTLMNESITRAAGANHGQEASPEAIEKWILDIGRTPRQRTTLYQEVPDDRRSASFNAAPLSPIVNDAIVKTRRDLSSAKPALV